MMGFFMWVGNEGLIGDEYLAAEKAWEHQQERIAELEQRIHEACEVYAGMEGFIPETAPEAYCLRVIEQMYQALVQEKQ